MVGRWVHHFQTGFRSVELYSSSWSLSDIILTAGWVRSLFIRRVKGHGWATDTDGSDIGTARRRATSCVCVVTHFSLLGVVKVSADYDSHILPRFSQATRNFQMLKWQFSSRIFLACRETSLLAYSYISRFPNTKNNKDFHSFALT